MRLLELLRFGFARCAVERPSLRMLIKSIRERNLTYVSRRKMKRCALALDLVRRGNVPGEIIEAGVALGGTAILLAKVRPAGRRLRLYDVFAMIPPPSERDADDAKSRYAEIKGGLASGINGEEYYGYRENLIAQVVENLKSFEIDPSRDAIEFYPGTFEETMMIDTPVAFAHIDCDWYDSVTTCIERISPRLSDGGIMVFDDYRSYAGCKKAVDEFLARRRDMEVLFSDGSIGIRKGLTT